MDAIVHFWLIAKRSCNSPTRVARRSTIECDPPRSIARSRLASPQVHRREPARGELGRRPRRTPQPRGAMRSLTPSGAAAVRCIAKARGEGTTDTRTSPGALLLSRPMAKEKTGDVDGLVDRGLQAVDDGELEAAESLLDDARGLVGENHPRTLHLAGMLAWAKGDLERANGYLLQAADTGNDRADIQLDCAECLFAGDEIDEAEAQVRSALALPGITRGQTDDGRLLLAQIRLAADDAEEALEVLGEIDKSLHGHAAYLSTRGAAQLASGKLDKAIADFEGALVQEPDDADLHYQVGLAYRAGEQRDKSSASMLRVLELDAAEDGPTAEPSFAEVQELRTRLEDVLEQLPDPLLRLLANAPITVQARATTEQVKAGLDPRSAVCFTGTAKEGDEEAELTGIVVMRDLLPPEPEDEEELETELFYGLMDELQGFFGRDDLVLAEA
jgi:tetratricopeptide (TPR) repeat protein